MASIGEAAKQIFEKAQLPNELLGRIWSLADTEQKGELSVTGFVIAMHLLASHRNGSMRALPSVLPPGIYEAASRRGPLRQMAGSRPTSGVALLNQVPRQFSGAEFPAASSPDIRPSYTQTQTSTPPISGDWLVTPGNKNEFDQIFSNLDTLNRGFINGDQAVTFFSNSRLPEDTLAQIWDLADINCEGSLNKDEFAVAMFLIRQQRNNKDGRDPLPQTLPSNLVPPSMRRRQLAPAQPSFPDFDSTNNVAASKPASEDLFGLDDAFTKPPSQIAQSTGDSAIYGSSPPANKVSPQITPLPQPQKSFVPISSYGQTLMSPHSTGPSNSVGVFENRNTSQKSPFGTADLLGDNDPVVSKKLTQETMELANLSNQVSTLTSHMQEVKSKSVSTEEGLSKAQAQKRDFEARLSQLRSAYEQEVLAVKALDERLASSRIEIKQLEQEFSLVDSNYQDVQNQHRQLVGALEADQQENLRLKERIRQTNTELNELKPQLEKTRSELRHQKGLVTINKKQLSINESEREKLKGDLEASSKELEDARREAEESTRDLETKTDSSTPVPAAGPPVASTNMNPFLRRAPTASSDKEVGSSFAPRDLGAPNHDAFDSIFGPSRSSDLEVPPTSSKVEASAYSQSSLPSLAKTTQSLKSSDGPDVPTPSDSPPPGAKEAFQPSAIPPPPPQSRQITSSFLPFRTMQRNDSTSSSVKVVPPASRGGDYSGSATPVERQMVSSDGPEYIGKGHELETSDKKVTELNAVLSPQPVLPSTDSGNTEYLFNDDVGRYLGQQSTSRELPGSLPSHSPAPPALDPSAPPKGVFSHGETASPPFLSQGDNPFGVLDDKPRTPIASKDDFNAAFEGFPIAAKAADKSNGVSTTVPKASKTHDEFPPIQDVAVDDESDSEYSVHGFDDDFTAASPRRAIVDVSKPSAPQHSAEENYSTQQRPSILTNESNQSELPTPGAQPSPPPYKETTSPHQLGESNHFPPEFTGLLPSREVPQSLPIASSSYPTNQKTGSSVTNEKAPTLSGPAPPEASTSSLPPALKPLAPGASAAPFAFDQSSTKATQLLSPPPVPAKAAINDDFDDAFDDLSEAKEADEKGDDELSSARKDIFDEFNPIFDSPTPSKSAGYPSSTFTAHGDFRDFESNIGVSGQAPNIRQQNEQKPSASTRGWDAIFADLDDPQNNGVQTEPQFAQKSKPASILPQGQGSKDPDDPFVERLTGLGYPRESSVRALEKFDYNIDKVCSTPSPS